MASLKNPETPALVNPGRLYVLTVMQGTLLSPAWLAWAKAFQQALGAAHCWYRVTPGCWVICTAEDAPTWNARLKPHLPSGGTLLITKADPKDRQGWMAQDFWTWWTEHAAHCVASEVAQPVGTQS